MGCVVVYQSLTVAATRRRTTPLGWLAAWCVKKAAGTVFQGSVSALLVDSWLGRLSAALAIALALGAIFDLSIGVFIHAPHQPLVVGSLAGTLAFGGGGGVGGAIVGALWGWLVGKLADVVSAKLTLEPAAHLLGTVGAWCVAALVGYWVGKAATWCYEHLPFRRSRFRRTVEYAAALLSIGAIGGFLFQLGLYAVHKWGYLDLLATSYSDELVLTSWFVACVVLGIHPVSDWFVHELSSAMRARSYATDRWLRDLRDGRGYGGIKYTKYEWTPVGEFCFALHRHTIQTWLAVLGTLSILWLFHQPFGLWKTSVWDQALPAVLLWLLSVALPPLYICVDRKYSEASRRADDYQRRFVDWVRNRETNSEDLSAIERLFSRLPATTPYEPPYHNLFGPQVDRKTAFESWREQREAQEAREWIAASRRRAPYKAESWYQFMLRRHQGTVGIWASLFLLGSILIAERLVRFN